MARFGTLIDPVRLPHEPKNPWARQKTAGRWLWIPKERRFLKLSANAKNVYVALAARARNGGEWVYVKQSTISKDLGWIRGLRSALKELAHAGYLVVVPQYRRSSIYLLTDPDKVEKNLWMAHGHPRGGPLVGPLAKGIVGKRARQSLNTVPDNTMKW